MREKILLHLTALKMPVLSEIIFPVVFALIVSLPERFSSGFFQVSAEMTPPQKSSTVIHGSFAFLYQHDFTNLEYLFLYIR